MHSGSHPQVAMTIKTMQNPKCGLGPGILVVEKATEKTRDSLALISRGRLTFMTSSSADLHSVDSDTSTTDPSSCTATTLTGTDTVLPVRMAVLRTSVSCMHTHTIMGQALEKQKAQNTAEIRPQNQNLLSDRKGSDNSLHTACELPAINAVTIFQAKICVWTTKFWSDRHTDLLFLSPFTGLAVMEMKSITQPCAKAHLWVGRTSACFKHHLQGCQRLSPPLCPKSCPGYRRQLPSTTATVFLSCWFSQQLSQLSLFWT